MTFPQRTILGWLATSLVATCVGCGAEGEEETPPDTSQGTGGATEGDPRSPTGGSAPSSSGASAGAGGTASASETGGGAGSASGGQVVESGGMPGVGGSEASTGGADSGGAAGSGEAGTGGQGGADGGSPGSGGSQSTVDSEGCPLTQEGFSTLSSMDQNGTWGGANGPVFTVTNQADLEMFASAEEPLVIRIDGKIVVSPKGKEIEVNSDKTIVGIGTTGEIAEGGFFIGPGKHNIILRNLTIGDTYLEGDPDGKEQDWDGVQMDTAHHIWIDHCDFHHGGDGLIDSRKDTTNLTVSWSLLRDHNKAFGIGWTDNVSAEMTLHHNILRDTGQRNPSTDNVLRAHLFNNWLLRTGSYGNYARGGTNMVIEHSVFEDLKDPHYYDSGSLVAVGNVYLDTSGQRESSGSSYSSFDPSHFYDYELDDVDDVKALLDRCAGPRPSLGNEASDSE